MSTLQIIVGSTRPNRAADRFLPWLVARSEAHPSFDVEVLDLRDWPLPMFNEHFGTIGDPADPTYSDPIVKRWNNKVAEADAYLVVTPEYNHSIPGVLKNALDNVWFSFAMRNKPLGAVGYSGGIGGAIRAIEHLAHIAIEADMHPVRSSVVLPFLQSTFDDAGQPTSPATETALQIALDDLAWWSAALEKARAEGELTPATIRAYAAASSSADEAD